MPVRLLVSSPGSTVAVMADHGDSFGTAAALARPSASPAEALMDVLIGFAACFGAERRSAVYVSTPITTGPLFAEWYLRQADVGSTDYAARLREQIIAPNLERARPLVLACRDRFQGRLVIDPTGLPDVPGWSQYDYHEFWTRLIDRCIGVVVFAPGWEYSNGCALEFAAACNAGAELLSSTFRPLAVQEGARMLERAARKLAAVGADDSALRLALSRCGAAPAVAEGA